MHDAPAASHEERCEAMSEDRPAPPRRYSPAICSTCGGKWGYCDDDASPIVEDRPAPRKTEAEHFESILGEDQPDEAQVVDWKVEFEQAVRVEVPLGCERKPWLSSICKRGTHCCGIKHVADRPDETRDAEARQVSTPTTGNTWLRLQAVESALKGILIGWDADDDQQFDDALEAARVLMGFTLRAMKEMTGDGG